MSSVFRILLLLQQKEKAGLNEYSDKKTKIIICRSQKAIQRNVKG